MTIHEGRYDRVVQPHPCWQTHEATLYSYLTAQKAKEVDHKQKQT